MKIYAVLLTVLCTIVSESHSEKILFLYSNASPSHKNIAVPIIAGLADRGHNITVVSSFKTEAHKNVRDIMPFKNFEYFPGVNALEQRRQGIRAMLMADYGPILGFCEKLYNHKEFLDLLHEQFDLILMDAFTNECALGFVHKMGIPFIYIAPLPVPHHLTEYLGNRMPPSFVPNFLAHFSHRMDFGERTLNTIITALAPWGMRRPLQQHEAIYRKHLGNDLPGVDEILANVSMILTNSHFSFNFPRPTMPDVVEIGAVHCRPGRPLPKDIEEFVAGAKDGFILFSLGSIVRPTEMPEETRKAFVNVFTKLKQRVLWKWPNPMPDLPPNVKLLKWVPQQDVLAHPNIRLFITHGGLLSTQESIYHGVPMVAIPVFGDQDLNANRATDAGIALTVEILDMSEEKLESAIRQVLDSKRFTKAVKEMSAYIRDQPETPKDRAVFWVEYTLRHKGARHLHSVARELNFFQYYNLDVVALLFSVAASIILLTLFILKNVLQLAIRLIRGAVSQKKKIQ